MHFSIHREVFYELMIQVKHNNMNIQYQRDWSREKKGTNEMRFSGDFVFIAPSTFAFIHSLFPIDFLTFALCFSSNVVTWMDA